MSTAVHHHIPLEEFMVRPDRIEGEVIVSPGPKSRPFGDRQAFREQFSGLKRDGYLLRNDFSCMLGGRSLPIPDLAAVKLERRDEAIKNDGWLEGSPELVVEVASASNRKLHVRDQRDGSLSVLVEREAVVSALETVAQSVAR